MDKKNLKSAISKNLNKPKDEKNKDETIEKKEDIRFKLANKKEDKKQRKSFPVYMENNKIKELDKLCNITGYNRNELINIMIDFCIQNLELVRDE